MGLDPLTWWGVALLFAYIAGVFAAIDAILHTRTAQGATAWVLALLLIPFVALPFYRVFGRSKFDAYRKTMEAFEEELRKRDVQDVFAPYAVAPDANGDERDATELEAFSRMARMPFVRGNHVEPLINGDATFDSVFATAERAQRYLLVQFYIIRADDIGMRLQRALLDAAERGVAVYLLYDDIGSHGLDDSYLRTLQDAGVATSSFGGSRSLLKRFRLNFRNHRKIVVADGREGLVGGLNVGDEYMGHTEDYGEWRDTHCHVLGPAVLELQMSFLRDWYYATENLIDVSWQDVEPAPENQTALVASSGPADEVETCGLLFTHAIASAERRVWIATPYFIPDGRVLGALQLAALRGCDVRVIMPRSSDNALFKFVPYAYFADVARVGVKVFLYEPGFMHQKAMLIDDDYASVGTANLDTRSFLLNFESTCVVRDERFSKAIETMLEEDMSHATRLTLEDLNSRSFGFRLAVQTTRLLSPVL